MPAADFSTASVNDSSVCREGTSSPLTNARTGAKTARRRHARRRKPFVRSTTTIFSEFRKEAGQCVSSDDGNFDPARCVLSGRAVPRWSVALQTECSASASGWAWTTGAASKARPHGALSCVGSACHPARRPAVDGAARTAHLVYRRSAKDFTWGWSTAAAGPSPTAIGVAPDRWQTAGQRRPASREVNILLTRRYRR